MSNLVSSDAFTAQTVALREKIEGAAEVSRGAFAAGLADLVRLQAEEIDRLNRVVSDSTVIPARQVVQIATGTGSSRHAELFALASDGSLWRSDPDAHPADRGWVRLPRLPNAAEDVETLRETDARETARAEAERDRDLGPDLRRMEGAFR